VLDRIAHSEKTPTAVAEFLVRCVLDARRSATSRGHRLAAAIRRVLAREQEDLAGRARALVDAANRRTAEAAAFQRHAQRTLIQQALRPLADARREGTRIGRQLHAAALLHVQRTAAALDAHRERIRHAAELALERTAHGLERAAARHRLLDPRRVLGRGYALVRDEHGRVLPSATGIQRDQLLVIQLRDGSVRGRTEQVSIDG
jgi:exodeoxyribonuclease VII large subunit